MNDAIEERQVLYCITTPALNDWVYEVFKNSLFYVTRFPHLLCTIIALSINFSKKRSFVVGNLRMHRVLLKFQVQEQSVRLKIKNPWMLMLLYYPKILHLSLWYLAAGKF